jgi:predicted RNase H-like HicB family nuclease
MATAENVAIESANATISDMVDVRGRDEGWQPMKPEDSGENWTFEGERVIVDVSISYPPTEAGFAEAEPQETTRWAVCLETGPDTEDGWVVAEVIGLPGVASEGRSKAEALDNIREALSLALDELGAEGISGMVFPPYEISAGGQVVYVTV